MESLPHKSFPPAKIFCEEDEEPELFQKFPSTELSESITPQMIYPPKIIAPQCFSMTISFVK
jgi:hypothetical protein